MKIARSFRTKPQAATKTLTEHKFKEMYEQSDALLIATHGERNTKSAWESFLLLGNPNLRVLDLAKLHSKASIIIFEACVSGLGEESIGNDLLGFSHAVLASGATAFLGGLWRLSDEASALLMLFLFEELKINKERKSLAKYWRNAQMKLYQLDVAGVVAIYKNLKKGCAKACEENWIDTELKVRLTNTLENAIRDSQNLGVDFKHPFYWASFVLMGHAGHIL